MHLLPVLTDWWPGGGGQDEGPALREGLEESDITPGIEGFLFTALIVVLLIFIVRDMIRRMRRMKYRAQIEAEADGDEPEFPGEVTAAQISESQLRAREAAAAQRFGAAPAADETTRRDPSAETAEPASPEDLEGGRPRER